MSPLLIAAALIAIAKGQYLECPVPAGFTVAATADVPSAIIGKFKDGKTAMPGEPWQAGDEFDENSPRRGIEFILHKGNRWIVVFGEGGVATSFEVRAFDLANYGELIEIAVPPFREGDERCSAVENAAR